MATRNMTSRDKDVTMPPGQRFSVGPGHPALGIVGHAERAK
jgi:hypothetical protein